MLQVHYKNKKNIMLIQLEGELMLENVEQLKKEFHQYIEEYKYFVFDFKNVSMIDSSGLGYIVYCLKQTRALDGDIKIHHLENQAKLIFEITRVSSILDIYNTEAETLNSFKIMEKENESNYSNSEQIIA